LLPESHGGPKRFVRLDEFGSEARLVGEVLESPTVHTWEESGDTLALILDSFDECQLRVEHLARLIQRRIERWPTDRLVLRVACRTAQWPTALESVLASAFGDELVVAEIAPLRATDVVTIATARGLDGEATLDKILDARVGALAARPLLLNMLLDEDVSGGMPRDALALYRRAIPRLLQEHDGVRSATTSAPAPPQALLAGARRAAAMLVFGGRAAVTRHRAQDHGASDLTVSELAGGDEPTSQGRVSITEDLVGELLASGLFTSRGPDRFGFPHFSFAEFLAAEWLAASQLPDAQLRQLLHSSDGLVTPSLRNVAAWLIATEPERHGWIASEDPDVLLSAAVEIASAPLRGRVVDQLLDDAQVRAWDRLHYRALHFDGLAERLRPELASEAIERRLLAVEIAGDTKLTDLAIDLLELVDDGSLPIVLRVRAAIAVRDLDDGEPTSALAHIVRNPPDDDHAQELLGVALEASWPHALELSEVLDTLAPPKMRDLIGSYRMFANYTFASSLRVEDLPLALSWLVRVDEEGRSLDVLDRLVERIITLAGETIGADELDRLLAKYILNRAAHHQPLLRTRMRDEERCDPLADDGHRRTVLRHVLEELAQQTDGSKHLWSLTESSSGVGLFRAQDFAWLASELEHLPSDLRELALELAADGFRPYEASCREALFALPDGHPVKEQLRYWIDPLPVDDIRGVRWRKHHPPDGAPSTSDVENRINELLDRVDAGDLEGFWIADLEVATMPGHDSPTLRAPVSMRDRPRWALMSESTRGRLVASARTYVRNSRSETDRWVGQSVIHFPSVAGVHALVLLLEVDPAFVEELPAETWRAWAPSIYDSVESGEASESLDVLFDFARRNALAELQATALGEIEPRLSEHFYVREDIVAALWDAPFEDSLCDLLGRASDAALRDVQALLARHAFPRVRDELMRTLRGDVSADRTYAARLLVDHGGYEDWVALMAIVDEDEAFGREFLLSLASSARHRPGTALPPQALGDLYSRLTRLFPPEEDPQIEGAHAVGAREELGHWRDGLLGVLSTRADTESITVLRGLLDRFPERTTIRFRLREALEQARRNEFVPVDTGDLMRLSADPRRLLVRTSPELRTLVVEILEAIEREVLQGDVPEAQHLWDESVMRPKSEDSIADYLRNRIHDRLRGRSATTFREVQTRRSRPTGIPERTDIRVDVVPWGSDVTATVIIECKGAWNDDILTAMREQLVDRYLADVPGAEGVFLTIWFDPTSWSTDDPRRAKAVRRTRDGLQGELREQAEELRATGVGVSSAVIDASYARPA
jgi:hypothetical protein